MSDDRDQRIRRRAHEIWEREGRPHGKDTEHWERAVREIDSETAATPRPGGPASARGKEGTRASGSGQPAAAVPEAGASSGPAVAGGTGRGRSGRSAGGTKRTGG